MKRVDEILKLIQNCYWFRRRDEQIYWETNFLYEFSEFEFCFWWCLRRIIEESEEKSCKTVKTDNVNKDMLKTTRLSCDIVFLRRLEEKEIRKFSTLLGEKSRRLWMKVARNVREIVECDKQKLWICRNQRRKYRKKLSLRNSWVEKTRRFSAGRRNRADKTLLERKESEKKNLFVLVEFKFTFPVFLEVI
jgi:hypothetical protein